MTTPTTKKTAAESKKTSSKDTSKKKVIKSEKELENHVKETVAKKTDLEVVEEYIETNREMLRERAKQVSEAMYGNWFDIERFLKKTTYKNAQDAFQLLNLLKLAGYLSARKNEVRKREEYKIILSQVEVKQFILSQLQLLDAKRKELEYELSVCEDKIAKEEESRLSEIGKLKECS